MERRKKFICISILTANTNSIKFLLWIIYIIHGDSVVLSFPFSNSRHPKAFGSIHCYSEFQEQIKIECETKINLQFNKLIIWSPTLEFVSWVDGLWFPKKPYAYRFCRWIFKLQTKITPRLFGVEQFKNVQHKKTISLAYISDSSG